LNRIEGDGPYGVITSGAAYNYVREAVDDLGVACAVLKIGMSHPLPDQKIAAFLATREKILVVEELEPILEDHVKVVARNEGIDTPVYGKGFAGLMRYYEYTPDIVLNALAAFFEIDAPVPAGEDAGIAARPPVLCPGCPHRATYYAVKQVAPKNTIYPTDIGCYTLGLLPPYKTADFLLCMGSSIGTACGFAEATDQPVVAFLGDSTFYHSGIPPLVNAVHHDHNFVVVILDNSTTAMTGHQPHPGTPFDGMGNEAVPLDLEAVVRGLGVEHIEVVDPRNLKEAAEGIKRALDHDGLSVVISKAPCILLERRAKKGSVLYAVNQETCKKCKLCVKTFACPALYTDGEDVRINAALCTGCGVCSQVCPYGAIEVVP
jgi:indolepyruvate ferredoxin oxidoreductase alpha subunit